MTRKQFAILILVISITDGFIVGALISATASPLIGIPIGIAAIALPWIILAACGPAIWALMGMNRVQEQYPLLDPNIFGKDAKVISIAVRQKWIGISNCIEALADDNHLHLRLALPGPSGRLGVSIPWEAVTSIEAEKSIARIDIIGVPPMWVPIKLVNREIEVRQIQLPSDVESPATSA